MEVIDIGKARLCVSATRVGGRDHIDIRAYVTGPKGQLLPTKTGILIPAQHIKAVMAAASVEHENLMQKEPAVLYYFKERVEDKRAVRSVHSWQITSTAKEAVCKSPEEYGAEQHRGYIFKCREYEWKNTVCHFQPTKPFAVWDAERNKWLRWETK